MNIQENKSEFEQIKDTVLLWLKHWYYFVISMVICGTLAFVYYKTKTPVMKVSALVSLRHDESLGAAGSSVSKGQSLLSAFGLGGGKSQNIEDETLKMGSQGYIKKIVRKYNLNFDYTQTYCFGLVKKKRYDYPPLILSVDQAISDTISPVVFTLDVKKDRTKIKMKFRKKTLGKYEVTSFPSVLETPFGAYTISKSDFYDDYKKPMTIKVFHANYDFMAQIYQKTLLIDFEKKTSDLIHLNMNSENVILAKKILNEIISNYNYEWESDKNLVTDKTLTFINERLQVVENELQKADLSIKNFKDRANLTDIEADVKYYLTLSGELQPALLEAETQLKTNEIIVDFVKDENNKYALLPLNPNMTNLAVAEVVGKYNELLIKRNEMYKSDLQSPLVKELDKTVELQRETLLKMVDNSKKSLQIALNDLKKKESEIKNKIGKIPEIEKDYLQLKRQQELQQTIYIFLLEMREQTGVKGISLLPKLQMIDEPYAVNKPVEPNLIKIAITTLFFGGLFPLLVIYGFPLIKRRKEK